MNIHIKSITAVLLFGLSALLNASEPIITKSFTGSWYDPAKNGQGFLLEIIKSNNQKKALTTWFTFDNAGNQYWLIGFGEIENQSINFQMLLPEGGQFGNAHNPNNMTNTVWGHVTFTFNDCNNGTVSWHPDVTGFSTGSMPIARNSVINNLNCTGGLFDELGDLSGDSEIITPLLSTGIDSDAYGKTKNEQRADRVDFSVEIEDLPVGVYQFFVGNVFKGNIEVIATTGGKTEGEIEFRDPVEPGKFLLDFDPHNQVVDIIQNNVIYLTSEGSNGGNNNGQNSSQNAPPFGNSEIEVYMSNSGRYPLGKVKTKLEQRSNRVDFKVELEDVPLGFYDFIVNGEIKGVIQVVSTTSGLEGEIEFRNPIEAGKQLLDFNPLGAILAITQGSDVLFSVNFPESGGSSTGNPINCLIEPNDDSCTNGANTQHVDIEVDFTNSGIDSDASGEVEYEVRSDRRDFKVEVEDLDFGTYQLIIGGQIINTIQVNSNEAELEFRDPVEPGKIILDFNPINQLVEIKKNGLVYLSVLLQ